MLLFLAFAAAAPDADDRLDWAREQVPALGEHTSRDPDLLWPTVKAWFEGESPHQVFLGAPHSCEPVTGALEGERFVGRWRIDEQLDDEEKRRSGHTVALSPESVTEAGPSGEVFRHDASGAWVEVGAFAGSGSWNLTERVLTEVTAEHARYQGERYTVRLLCGMQHHESQQCADDEERTCTRCTRVDVLPVPLDGGGMAVSGGMSIVVGGAPGDCRVPCPADSVAASLPELNAAVAQRVFTRVLPGGLDVFRTREACEKGLGAAP